METCVKLLMLTGLQLNGSPPRIPAEDIWAAYVRKRLTNAVRVPGEVLFVKLLRFENEFEQMKQQNFNRKCVFNS